MERLLHDEPGVFRRIALFIVYDSDFLTPLDDFLNLFLVCQASHEILSKGSAPLYFDIFSATFDILGPLSRLGKTIVQEYAQDELQRRFRALKILRRGNLDDPDLTEALWIAYMMFEDSDKGHKNVKRLFSVSLHGLLNDFVRRRLYRGSENNNGWPIPNEQNSLAVALLWLSSSLQSLNREGKEQQEGLNRSLQPLVFAAFRYPIFGTAEFCFDSAKQSNTHQSTSFSIHGPYPPPPLDSRNVAYFGPFSRAMRVPSISLFSALSFFARHELMPLEIPPHLSSENRINAVGAHQGPTADDIKYFHEHCQTHFADFPGIDVGVIRGRADEPPTLLTSSTIPEPPPYKLGTFTGRWQGSFIVPFLEVYDNWLTTLAAPPEFSTPGRSPLYLSLQEHYVHELDAMVPSCDAKEGTKNAWLPAGFKWIQRETGIEVFDEEGTFRSFYHTFRRGDSPPSGHVVDVIITGRTDPRHAAAWGDHEIVGRVRLEDGLIVLARKPLTEDQGTTLLRGYGKYLNHDKPTNGFKGLSSGTQPAAWEAVFSLCQVREATM